MDYQQNEYDVAAHLAVMVRRSIKIVDQKKESIKNAEGILDNFEQVACKLRKIRTARDRDSGGKKLVGVFGIPKRGKSTLINVLLGENLLPTSSVPMSSSVIEIESDRSIEGWKITTEYDDARCEYENHNSLKDAAEHIELVGSRRGRVSAKRILVQGAFPNCKVFDKHSCKLVDTPGAESAFSEESISEDEGKSQEDLRRETQRAIQEMNRMHLVLFCLRADYLETEADSRLYQEHIHKLLPLNVVGFKDKWENGPEDLLNHARTKHHLYKKRTLAISASSVARAENPSQALREESGIVELEDRIDIELQLFKPEIGIPICFAEYKAALNLRRWLLPEKIHILNFVKVLERCGCDWSNVIRAEINANAASWKVD